MKKINVLLLVLLLQAFFAGIGYSATWNVPTDFSTIQAAIDAAVNGDEIWVNSGTYLENIDFKGKAIVVMKLQSAPSKPIIDGTQAGSVVSFLSGEGSDSKLSGFNITNGNSSQGGGIKMINNSNPLILDCNIYLNKAYEGGGIYCGSNTDPATNPVIKGNVIKYNNAIGNVSSIPGGGGGIFCENASPKIIDNDIFCNTDFTVRTAPPFTLGGGGICLSGECNAEIYDNVMYTNTTQNGSGGAIACYKEDAPNAAPKIMDNTIYGNRALGTLVDAVSYTYMGTGGAISCKFAVDPRIADNDIYNNYAVKYGGGIELLGKPGLSHAGTRIMDNLIHENTCLEGGAPSIGGGIYCANKRNPGIYNNVLFVNEADLGGGIAISFNSDPLVRNNLIFENLAYDYGGGIYLFNGDSAKTLGLHSNTIAWNVAQGLNNFYGGGIYSNFYNVDVVSCIMWGNNASIGPNGGEIEFIGNGNQKLRINYSDVRGCNPQTVWVRVTSGIYSTLNSISQNPLFVSSPPTGKDYRLSHLAPNISPCINTGSPNITEVFGTTRTDNLLDEVGANLDMGFHYVGFTATYLPPNVELSLLTDCIAPPTSQQQIMFALYAGLRYAGRQYALLGSMSLGTIPLPGGLSLPFGWDAYYVFVLNNLTNPNIFQNFTANLDHLGRVRPNDPNGPVLWIIPPGLLSTGQNYYYAFSTVTPYDYVSSRVDITVQ